MKVDATGAAALGPFKKSTHDHGRESEKSLLCFGCDFSGWYSFGKIIKSVASRCHNYFEGKMHQIRFWPSQTPLWELTALPGPLAGFKGAYF